MADEKQTAPNPADIVTHANSEIALKADKGENVKLESFKVIDFTSKGDNYASFVTSIRVEYKQEGSEEILEDSYIAKLNPLRESEAWEECTNGFFVHEGEFICKIVPKFNELLNSFNERRLRIPICHHASYDSRKEILILEDLREQGFKMVDRRKGLDFAHIGLVIEELARMHASSQIVEKRSGEELDTTFPFLAEDLFDENSSVMKVFEAMIVSQFEVSLKMLQEIGNYDTEIELLRKFQRNTTPIYMEQTAKPKCPKFKTIIHGDCWSNNFLFK